jgi:hypothetical protein
VLLLVLVIVLLKCAIVSAATVAVCPAVVNAVLTLLQVCSTVP